MNFLKKEQNRKISLLLALMFLASLCLSVLFVHAEFDHDCTGEDCPVCAVIQIARTNFQNLSASSSLSVTTALPSCIALSFFLWSAIFVLKTPVTEKIKLNN